MINGVRSYKRRSDGSQAMLFVFAFLIALLSEFLVVAWVEWWRGIIIAMIVFLSLGWLGEL